MEELCPIIMIALFVGVFVTVLLGQRQRNRALDASFRQISCHYDGTLSPRTFTKLPSVRFVRRGVSVLLDTFSTGGEHPTRYTQLHFAWPHAHLRLEVFPERTFQTIGKLFGAQDIEIGSSSFDRAYIIRGNDENLIRETLTGGVQATIDTLRLFLGNDDIYISTKAGTLLIKKKSLIAEAALLERFIQLGFALYDELTESDRAGIEFVDQPESSFSLDAANAVCQICGEKITEDIVSCRSCLTPHHRECWVYYGKCSTYGCGETRFSSLQQ